MQDLTGSGLRGLAPAFNNNLKCAGNKFPSIVYVNGNPHNSITWNNGSDIAIDSANGKYYRADGDLSGSAWLNIGSTN